MITVIKNSVLPITSALVSISTLTYIIDDNHKYQMKRQAKYFEEKIKILEDNNYAIRKYMLDKKCTNE
jgi:hypothetical protein